MGDLGLEGAYGSAALQQMLAKRHEETLKEQQQQWSNKFQERQLASQEELKNAQLASLADSRLGAQQDRETGLAMKLNDQIPAGFLRSSNQAVPLLQKIGAAEPTPATQPMGSDFSGPMPNFETPQEAQVGRPAGFLKTASQAQNVAESTRQDKFADNERAAAKDAAAQANFDRTATETNRYHTGMLNKPAAGADAVVKVEHKDPTTGRTVIEYLPKSDVRGKTFEKGASSATENRLASAQAVNQTGEDIIRQLSDPAVAAKLGPTMGRYAKLQDFIGNPPPEFSELAGAIESYSLANMGVHGMRSAQGAQMIAKLLNQPHTPESIIAAIRGLNSFSQHFMQNEGRAPQTQTKKPTAAELIQKYR
jgi:hypothetical protein